MTPYPRSALLALMATTVLIGACTGGEKPAPATAAPQASRPPIAVSTAPVQAGEMVDAVNVVGSLEPKFSADVKSEVTGIINAVLVTEWVTVHKGQVLATLEMSESQAAIEAMKASVAQAKVSETRARREYERSLNLKQYGLITPQALDDAKSAVEAAETVVAAAAAQLKATEIRLKKSTITAPMNGVVAMRGVSVGDRVENMGGSPMFRIVDNRLLDLTVSVPSTRLADVKIGQVIAFTSDVAPGRTFTGKVMFINPALDAASRSAKVVAEVRNDDGALKGGSFVKGNILVATRTGVLQVPREALLNWNVDTESAELLVVKGDQTETRAVKTGRSSSAGVEIVSGANAGELVVVRGAFAVRPGDRIAVAKGQGA